MPISDNVISSREEEVNRLVSESYFNLSDYKNAEIYFRKYLEISETNKIEDYFQMGQINIFLEDYEEAIDSLDTAAVYVIYCSGDECSLSMDLAEYLFNELLFEKVLIFEGGWPQWRDAEYPL